MTSDPLQGAPVRRRHGQPQLLLALLFLASRLGLLAAGIQTNMYYLAGGWQHLDLEVLRTDLPGALWHLHSQPPLWNGVIGVLLILAGGDPAKVFWLYTALAWAMSLSIALIIHHLVQKLTLRRWLAFGSASFYILFSAAYFYENYIFYPLFTAFLATVCGLASCRAALAATGQGRLRWLALALAALLALTLTWSLFHPLIVALGGAVLLVALNGLPHWRRPDRRALVITALAVLLALVVPLKNQLLYSHFGTGTWMGMNIKGVVDQAPPILEPDLDCGYQTPPSAEENRLGREGLHPSVASHPVNAEVRKRGGFLNLNNVGYIGRSKRCLAAAHRQLMANPQALLRNRLQTLIVSSTHLADNYFVLPKGMPDGSPAFRGFEARNAIYLRMPWKRGELYLAPALALLTVVLILPLQWLVLRRRRCLPAGWSSLLAITLLLVLWVVVVGHLANSGEQERFRFTVEPLMLTALSVGLGLALPAAGRWREAPQPTIPEIET